MSAERVDHLRLRRGLHALALIGDRAEVDLKVLTSTTEQSVLTGLITAATLTPGLDSRVPIDAVVVMINQAINGLERREQEAARLMWGFSGDRWSRSYTQRLKDAARLYGVSYEAFRPKNGTGKYEELKAHLATQIIRRATVAPDEPTHDETSAIAATMTATTEGNAADQVPTIDPAVDGDSVSPAELGTHRRKLRRVVAGIAVAAVLAVLAVVALANATSDPDERSDSTTTRGSIEASVTDPSISSAAAEKGSVEHSPPSTVSTVPLTVPAPVPPLSIPSVECGRELTPAGRLTEEDRLNLDAEASAMSELIRDGECTAGDVSRLGTMLYVEILAGEGSAGAVVLVVSRPPLRLKRNEWGAYKEILSNPEEVPNLAGYPTSVRSEQGSIIVELSMGGMLIGPSTEGPLFWIPGQAKETWLESGGVDGTLGYPTTMVYADELTLRQDYEHASLVAANPEADVARVEFAPDSLSLEPYGPVAGRIVRQQPGPTAWYVDPVTNERRWIPDGPTWDCLGGTDNSVGPVFAPAVWTLPLGPMATCPAES